MDPGEIERLVQLHGSLLTTAEAHEAGLTKSALRWARDRGVLRTLRRGVVTSTSLWERSSPVQRHLLLIRAHQRIHPELVACGLSAAVVLRLPVPGSGIPERPVLVRPRERSGPGGSGRRGGMLGRLAWLDQRDIYVVKSSGLRVTSPIRTVLDSTREVDPFWGLAMGDHLLEHHDVTGEALVAAADERIHVSGGTRSRWVAHHARPGVESPLESLGRARIVRGGFAEPDIQSLVQTHLGPFRVDLLDPRTRVITEADGKVKYSTREDLYGEKRREDALRDAGFEVVRFTMADHHRPARWLGAYREAILRAARRVPKP